VDCCSEAVFNKGYFAHIETPIKIKPTISKITKIFISRCFVILEVSIVRSKSLRAR
jgi:hypothetical protein